MTITGMLGLIVLLIAIVVYFVCVGFGKAQIGRVAEIFILAAAIAVMMALAGQSSGCTIVSTGSGHSSK